MKKLLFIFILLSVSLLLTAQRAVEVIHTQNDGLFTNQVISLGLDVEGRLWVSYSLFDRFSRFDGLHWDHWVLLDEGIRGNFHLLAGDENGFWFRGKDQVLLHTNKGEWKKLPTDQFNAFFHPDLNEVVFLEKFSGQVFLFDPQSPDYFTLSEFSFQFPAREYHIEEPRFSFLKDEMLFLHSYFKDQWHYIEKYELSSGKKLGREKTSVQSERFLLHQNALFFWVEGRLKIYENGNLNPFQFQAADGRIFENLSAIDVRSDTGYFRVFKVKESIPNQHPRYHFVTLNQNLEAEIYMENIHRTANNSIVLLPNGDQVYSSGSGLIHRKNGMLHLSDRDYPMVAGMHMLAEDGHGNIWFGGYEGEGGFAYFDGERIREPEDKNLRGGLMLTGSYTDKNGRIYYFQQGSEGIHAIENGKRYIPYSWDFFYTGFFINTLRNGHLGVGTHRLGFMKFDPENPSDYYLVGEDQGLDFINIICFDEDKYGRIWMGRTSMGMAAYCFEKQLLGKWDRNNIEPLSDGGMALIIDSTHQLWAGGNKGLYFLKDPHLYDIENGNLFDDWIKISLPGPENQFIINLLEVDQYIIAGSDYAMHFIPKDQDFESSATPLVHSLSFQGDIPGLAAEQNAILQDSRGYVWTGTLEGALRFDLDILEFDRSDTRLSLTKAITGNDSLDISRDKMVLTGGTRSLDLYWNATGNTLLQDNVYFRVTIFGKNGETFYQVDSRPMSALINYLPPGNYRLRLEAIKHNQVNHYIEKMVVVPFHWFENPLHIVGLTLFGVAVLILIYAMRTKQQRLEAEKKAIVEKNQAQMDQLRVKALSNFFNPHFINNVLHWIQSKYRKDPETREIVGKLAENVEFLFHNTLVEKKAHELSKELRIVDNYVAIALTRFGNIFEFKKNIELSEETLQMVKVPNLLLQIHVENAIEKGIRGHTDFGLLELRIFEDEKYIHVDIVDNGVGRKNQDHLPLERKSSTRVMEEIIQLLNKSNSSHIVISYEDNCIKKEDPKGKDHGTKVKICIPKNYNYGQ